MKRANIIRDYLTELIRVGSILVLGMVQLRILLEYLGDDGYGVWVLIPEVIFWVTLAEPVIRSSLNRFVAEAYGRRAIRETSQILATLATIIAPIAIVSALTGVIFSPEIINSFDSFPEDLKPQGIFLLRMFCISTVFTAVTGLSSFLLHAISRIDVTNYLFIPLIWARSISYIVIAVTGFGLVGLAWAQVILAMFTSVAMCVIALRTVQGKGIISWKFFRPGRVPGLRNYLLFSAIARVGDSLRSRTTLILFGWFAGLETVAVLGVVEKIKQPAHMAMVSIADVAFPRLSKSVSREKDFTGMVSSFGTILGVFSICISLGMVLLAKPFILLWAPPEDALQVLVPIIQLSALVTLLEAGRMMFGRSLRAQNKVHLIAYGQLVEGVLSFVISIFLGYAMGVLGLLLARAIVSGVYLLVFVPLCFGKAAKIKAPIYYTSCYIRPLLAGCVGAVPLFLISQYSSLSTWGTFLGLGIPGLAVLCCIVGLFGTSHEIRTEIIQRARTIFR